MVTTLVDLGVNFVLLAALMLWYRFPPGWQMLVLPAMVLLTFALSVGIGLLLAALNVEYRDFRFIVPFIVQFGLFVSPIAFETSSVPARWRLLYSLNPLVGIIDGFRWAILGGRVAFMPLSFVVSALVTMLCLLAGVWYFRRTERSFADII